MCAAAAACSNEETRTDDRPQPLKIRQEPHQSWAKMKEPYQELEDDGDSSEECLQDEKLQDEETPEQQAEEEAAPQFAPASEQALTASTEAKGSRGQGGDTNTANISFKDLTSDHLRPFAIISTSYLLFTVTDGAIRMIVLLHAYNLNFSALEVAIMFTLYELAGAVTNLLAGVMGAKWGIKITLITGLTLQLAAYGMLFGWNPAWSKGQATIFVTFAQMLAGIAKDLTKLGGKTVTKLVTPEEQNTRLFKLVSLITGWKNSLKGVGYFLGSALIGVSYQLALGFMMGLLVLAMPGDIGAGQYAGDGQEEEFDAEGDLRHGQSAAQRAELGPAVPVCVARLLVRGAPAVLSAQSGMRGVGRSVYGCVLLRWRCCLWRG